MARAVFRSGALKKAVLTALVVVTAYAVWIGIWASRGDQLAPLRSGLDRCFECGMIVSDVGNSISVLDTDEQGHPVTRHFDDPGCFEKFKKTKPNQQWKGVARDPVTGKELPLDQIRIIQDGRETAMGSGLTVVPAVSPQ